MVRVRFIDGNGGSHTADGAVGTTLMQLARDNNVTHIDAVCGGACACGTCHVYVAPEWLFRLAPPSEDELTTLDLEADVKSNSRLSCQIVLEDALDGLVVRPRSSPY